MGNTYGIRQSLKEFSVLVPAYGFVSAQLDLSKGNIPFIFQSPNENGESNLELIAKSRKSHNLSSEKRNSLRNKENKLLHSLFWAYHSITTAYFLKDLF